MVLVASVFLIVRGRTQTQTAEEVAGKLFRRNWDEAMPVNQLPTTSKSDWPFLYFALYTCGLTNHEHKTIDYEACEKFTDLVASPRFKSSVNLIRAFAIFKKTSDLNKAIPALKEVTAAESFDLAYFEISQEVAKQTLRDYPLSIDHYIDYFAMPSIAILPDYGQLMKFIEAYSKDQPELVWELGNSLRRTELKPFAGTSNFLPVRIGIALQSKLLKNCESNLCQERKPVVEKADGDLENLMKTNPGVIAGQEFKHFMESESVGKNFDDAYSQWDKWIQIPDNKIKLQKYLETDPLWAEFTRMNAKHSTF